MTKYFLILWITVYPLHGERSYEIQQVYFKPHPCLDVDRDIHLFSTNNENFKIDSQCIQIDTTVNGVPINDYIN